MKREPFDALARRMAESQTRRGAVMTLLGGALAAATGVAAVSGASAEHEEEICPYEWYNDTCYKPCKHGWHYCKKHGELYCCKGKKKKRAKEYHWEVPV